MNFNSGLGRVFCLILLTCVGAHGFALGLGDLHSHSYLGEPLDAEIDVVGGDENLDASQVRVQRLSASEARKIGIDLVASSYFRLRLSLREDNGRIVAIKISSDTPLREPYIDFVVKLDWPTGSVFREYEVLLDTKSLRAGAVSASANRASHPGPGPGPGNGGDRYRVRSGDSLSSIANKLGLSDADERSLFVDNPQAFINGDINRLKAGSVLRLSTDSSRPALAQVQDKGLRSSASPASQAQAKNKAGRLTLSQVDDSAHQDEEESLRAKIDGTQEMIDMLVKENQELRGRVEKIESSDYLTMLTQLVSEQRKQIDDLRNQMDSVNSRQKLDWRDSEADLAASGKDAVRAGTGIEVANSLPNVESEFDSTFGGSVWLFLLFVILGVSAVVGLGVATYLYLLGNKKQARAEISDRGYLEFNETGSDFDMMTQQFSRNGREFNGKPLSERLREQKAFAVDPKKQIKDDEVKARIRQKTEEYLHSESRSQAPSRINEVEIDVLMSLDEEVNELLSMAKLYCNSGKYSEARAILTAQQAVEADPRIAEALAEIEELESQRTT